MQIVIELTDEMYANVQAEVERSIHPSRDARWTRLLLAICNGEVLPKGHGRIVDIDNAVKDFASFQESFWAFYASGYEPKVDYTGEVLIEADKEAADERHS